MLFIVVLLFGLPSIFVTIDFVAFLITGEHLFNKIAIRFLEVIVVVALPLFYFIVMDESSNDCCNESATFSPDHKLTIYAFVLVCQVFYFYSTFKHSIKSPLLEVMSNCFLLLGIAFNIFIAIQVGIFVSLFGNLPIILLFIFQLIKNHKQFNEYAIAFSENGNGMLNRLATKILISNPFIKVPVLLVLCLPLITIVICFLLLFGQKPDSLIRAFTDTYKHGFSELDYLCENVDCGGHFLCSVAANGHKKIVVPQRYGERAGRKIICNRQLLISNAFEELIEQKLPFAHNIIRKNYNKVGNVIHRYYGIFNNKYVADVIYIFMKPLEWMFLFVLYLFDKYPENRIEKQYIKASEKLVINELIQNKR